MNPWLVLVPVAAVMACGSWLSYQPALKPRDWYPWAMVALAGVNGWLWAQAARLTAADPGRQYALSLAWDAVTVLAYSGLPLVLFGVRPTPPVLAGLVLVVAGACLVKWG